MLGGLVFCLANVLGRSEVWPHTPAAEACFLVGAWVLFVAALPQLLWVGWHWLLAWQGPTLLRCLATAAFLAGAGVAGLLWLVIIIIGLHSVLNGQLIPQPK